VDAARIEALHAPVERWLRKGIRAPLVFTLDELQRSADVFAIELLDMKTHHRMLHGEDVLAGLTVPLHYHAIQVERELRTDWLRLRQAILTSPKKGDAHLNLMTSSFSAFAALFRHALIALGQQPAANKRETIERMGQFAPRRCKRVSHHPRFSRRETQEAGNRRRGNLGAIFHVRGSRNE